MCFGKMAFKLQDIQVQWPGKFYQFVLALLGFLLCGQTLASRLGCNNALGMQDGSIKDGQLTSQSKNTGYGPTKGRLNGGGSWCSYSEKPWTEYFQIELDKVRHIFAIGTQGYQISLLVASRSYWVQTYAIRYSYDGSQWYWFEEKKLFYGNNDYNTEKRNMFSDTFVTKYLRIYPITFKVDMCMRVELYGCPDDKECSQFLPKSSGIISSPNYPSPYPKGMDCTWIIDLPDKSKHVALFFKDFDVNDGMSWGCSGDSVQVLDGLHSTSASLGQYCNGGDSPLLKGKDSSLRVHFHSKFDSNPRNGFQAQFLSFTPGLDDVLSSAACQDSVITLNCSSSSKTITILHAFYGTSSFSGHCGSPGSNTTCQASGVTNLITSLCEHHKVCKLDVTMPQFIVLCAAGMKPRLDVYYQCTGTMVKTLPPTTTTAPPPLTTTLSPTTLSPTTNSTPSPTIDITILPGQTPLPPVTSVPLTGNLSRNLSSTPTSQGVAGGDKLASTGGDTDIGMLVGIVVCLVCIIVIVVVALLCFLRRRRKKRSSMPDVNYTAAVVIPDRAPPVSRTGRSNSKSRANPYESVNVLYVSADDPYGKKKDPFEHIYDDPELQEALPQMTDNPLYHGATNFGDDYESIEEQPAGPPKSLAPSMYESPLPVRDVKSNTSASITNPNYEKSIIEMQDYQ